MTRTCILCGYTDDDKWGFAQHLANEHPAEWEMAVQVIALQLMGVDAL